MNINELLYQEESSTLDFKEEQYRFVDEKNKHIKSELLKDILAFANAWRESDAYILIGVREIKGGKSVVVGIDDDIDDASLQEFVNKKTNRPLDFQYCTILIDDKKIAYIQIPVQRRPFYIEKEYGRIKSNTVYLRRGSSTDIATPDEVSDMGVSSAGNKQALHNPVDYSVSVKLIPIPINYRDEQNEIEKNIKKAEEELIDLKKSTVTNASMMLGGDISPMRALREKSLDEYKRELDYYKTQLEQYVKSNKSKLQELENFLLKYAENKYLMKIELENTGSTSDTNIDVSVDILNATIIQDIKIFSYSDYLFDIKYPKKPSKTRDNIFLRQEIKTPSYNHDSFINHNAYRQNIKITNSSVSAIIRDMNVGDQVSLVNKRLFLETTEKDLEIKVIIKSKESTSKIVKDIEVEYSTQNIELDEIFKKN